MLGKLLSTSALHQECHTATPSLMFAQRVGSLRRREEGGTAGASRSKWTQPRKSMSFWSNQLIITVLVPELQCFRCQNLVLLPDIGPIKFCSYFF